MDLLQTVRKEGSRGGVNFSWDDVKSSQHRENYLGHSLMAPVGRWQKNKDLNWYAKADDADLTPEQREERAREQKREEMRKIKEAEEDAMARALGLPVPDRTNANNEPLGEGKISQSEVNKALKEVLNDGEEETERGPHFDSGRKESRRGLDREPRKSDRAHDGRRKDRSRSRSRERHHRIDDRDRAKKGHRRPRSRSREHDRERRHKHRHRSRSPSQPREKRRRSRSRDRYEDRHYDGDRHRRRSGYEERRKSPERERRRHRSRSR